MSKILIYANGNADNHGCEAITRSTVKILSLNKSNSFIETPNLANDKYYKVDLLSNLFEVNYGGEYNIFKRIVNKISRCILRKNICRSVLHYEKLENAFSNTDIALSAGGDNYCYPDAKWLENHNTLGKKMGTKLVLWGCSIGDDVLKKQDVVEDLKRFDLIIARESITYDNLMNYGVSKNVKIFPDPAFQLDTSELPLPVGFANLSTVGINVSPMIIGYESTNNLTMMNYRALIAYIIANTDCQVALIPHVVRKGGDDRRPLSQLFNEFKDTGRVVLIDDGNCMELKGFISRCRMFIGARTHATVAAYSTCVPTLVVGYSVKAKGIAKDIFGTYENYVIPVQSLTHEDDLVHSFKYIQENEDNIRKHLQNFMPSYIEKAGLAGEEIKKLIEK